MQAPEDHDESARAGNRPAFRVTPSFNRDGAERTCKAWLASAGLDPHRIDVGDFA